MGEKLTTAQVADMLGLAEQTLVAWRHRNNTSLPWIKLGHRTVRYDKQDVLDFMNNRVKSSIPKEEKQSPLNKSATLTVRMNPIIREALTVAAERDHRSLANMLEVLVIEYCRKHDIKIRPG